MIITSKEIKKFEKYSVAQLLKKAQTIFNKWVRKRSEDEPCINCGKYRTLQAGHFFPTSTHSHLRFHEDNCWGECKQCNFFNSQSHSYGYQPNLIKKIGQQRFDKLTELAKMKVGNKVDRFHYIYIILKYK